MTPDPWLMLNWLLRGAAIVLALMLAALLWREHPKRLAARLGAALGVGAAAFALSSAPGFAERLTVWHAPVMGLAAANTFVFWLFTRSLLEDGFVLRRWHALPWGLLMVMGATDCLFAQSLGRPWARAVGLSISLSTVALALLAMMQALTSWREDLVEERRRLRLFIVGGVGAQIVLTQLFVWLSGGDLRTAFSSLGNAAVLLALIGAIAWRLLHLPGQVLFAAFEAPVLPAGPAPAELAPTPVEPGHEADAPEPPDPRWLAVLHELMTVELVYREENLTIGALATRMQLPEHRLRRVINQGLGHRNFNAFLNTYRIEDVKRALADVRYDAVPILTLAMDAGFQSLGPFNRAFKAAAGMTPSDFRRQSRSPNLPKPAESAMQAG